MTAKLRLVLAATLLLGACQTAAPETQWTPREGHDLAADRAVCIKEATEANIQSSYGNNQAGAAAAAAMYIDADDIRGGGAERLFVAVRDGCMVKKGWTKVR